MEVVPCLLLCIPYIVRFGSIAAYVRTQPVRTYAGKKGKFLHIGDVLSAGSMVYSAQQIEIWRIELVKNKSIVMGIIIGVVMAILWSTVFINVLNSMAGIGVGVCLGISLGISFGLVFAKKNK